MSIEESKKRQHQRLIQTEEELILRVERVKTLLLAERDYGSAKLAAYPGGS